MLSPLSASNIDRILYYNSWSYRRDILVAGILGNWLVLYWAHNLSLSYFRMKVRNGFSYTHINLEDVFLEMRALNEHKQYKVP